MSGPDLDGATAHLRRALDVLFLSNPVGTSLGVLLGLVLHAAARAAADASLRPLAPWWAWVAAAVFAFNIGPYLRRHRLDPSLQNALAWLREEESRSLLPRSEIRQMYRDLYQRVLNDVTVRAEVRAPPPGEAPPSPAADPQLPLAPARPSDDG